jgi:hypothetical protein
MKAKKIIKTEQKFEPVTIELTFESRDELDYFKNIFKLNMSVPKIVFGFSSRSAEMPQYVHDVHDQILEALWEGEEDE